MIRNPLVNSLMGWYVYMDLLYSNNSHPLSSPPPPNIYPQLLVAVQNFCLIIRKHLVQEI